MNSDAVNSKKIFEEFQSGNKMSDTSILLVIESHLHSETSELKETNYITTPKEFHAANSLDGYRLACQTMNFFDCYHGPLGVGNTLQIHEINLGENPMHEADRITYFLDGHFNAPIIGVWQNADRVISDGAKAQLPKLLQPFMEIDAGHRLCPAEGLENYNDFLGKVFSLCELASVQRSRGSVTQGSAAVFCEGRKIVTFGDDMWMQKKNGMFTNGFHEVKAEGFHGPVLDGWGSLASDSQFIGSALRMYPERFAAALAPAKSLDQMIQSAEQKAPTSTGRETAPLELGR